LHHIDNLDGFSQYDPSDGDDDDSEMDDFFPAESCICSDDYDNADYFLNDYEQGQGQQSTAASKVQIKLNHLINSHKAPIKPYLLKPEKSQTSPTAMLEKSSQCNQKSQ